MNQFVENIKSSEIWKIIHSDKPVSEIISNLKSDIAINITA